MADTVNNPSAMAVKSPVLFLVFNRPEQTAKVFGAIKKARPAQLFIAADGPREGFDEETLCRQTREIASAVDWPCEVKTLFRKENLGCGKAVSGAINWFFEHVEQGIILEDDCLPGESFFEFCDTLLDKYAGDEKIMAVSGNNFLPGGWQAKRQSYFFAFMGVWGWATWRRAWKLYDYDMCGWQDKQNRLNIRKAMKSDYWYQYYSGMFDGAYKKELNTWDVQWIYCIFSHNGLPVTPSVNLVSNIGFGNGATHTADEASPYANTATHKMMFPLKHPDKLQIDKNYLRTSYRYMSFYGRSFIQSARLQLMWHLNALKKQSGE